MNCDPFQYIKSTHKIGNYSNAVVIPFRFIDKNKFIDGKPVFHVAKFGDVIILRQVDKHSTFSQVRGAIQ